MRRELFSFECLWCRGTVKVVLSCSGSTAGTDVSNWRHGMAEGGRGGALLFSERVVAARISGCAYLLTLRLLAARKSFC